MRAKHHRQSKRLHAETADAEQRQTRFPGKQHQRSEDQPPSGDQQKHSDVSDQMIHQFSEYRTITVLFIAFITIFYLAQPFFSVIVKGSVSTPQPVTAAVFLVSFFDFIGRS